MMLAAFLAYIAGVIQAASAPPAALCLENKHSVAVVIGNSDYGGTIPDVPYAVRDADAIRNFLTKRLCYRPGNIISLENATLGNFYKTFGRADTPEGKLWNWVRKGRSNVFIYYSGHGAPDIRTGDGFMVPVDGDPDIPALGFSLATLIANLKALKSERVGPDRHVTLVLDACFSGKEGTGKPLIKGSFSGWKPKRLETGDEILQFSAAGADQIARWDEVKKHGLFTRVFVDAVSGAADKDGFGNGDGVVAPDELTGYIRDEVGYHARRRYSDDQTPELPKADRIPWRFAIGLPTPPEPETPPEPSCDGIETTVAGRIACLKPGDTFRDCPDCPEMVVIPAGGFLMGATEDEVKGFDNATLFEAEFPRHHVTISKPFALGKYEITNTELVRYLNDAGRRFGKKPISGGDRLPMVDLKSEEEFSRILEDKGRFRVEKGFSDHPAVHVSWNGAKDFVDWLNIKTTRRLDGPYRLPSEPQWEYAARGGPKAHNGGQSTFWWGDEIDRNFLNYGGRQLIGDPVTGLDHWRETAPVGSFPANPFGLHDMNGNVSELLGDCFVAYPYVWSSFLRNLIGRHCFYRVLRGGSWFDAAEFQRSASRMTETVNSRHFLFGFRVARTLDPPDIRN